MRYIEVRSIVRVREYAVSTNNELFFIRDNFLLDADQNLIIEFKANQSYKIYYYQGDWLLINNYDSVVCRLNLSDNTLNKYFKEDYSVYDIRDGHIVFFDSHGSLCGISIGNKIIFSTKLSSGNIYFFLGKAFNVKFNEISLFNDSESFVWQQDLINLIGYTDNRLDKFFKFLGVHHNRAFILSDAGRIVVLDLQTGELIKVITSETFPIMRDAFMHPENHNIYCLHNWFVKINTETLEVEILKEIFNYKSKQDELNVLYSIKTSSYQGDYISFTSFTNFRSGFAKWIGLFDFEKAEIIWHKELLTEEGQLSFPAGETPQIVGNKLYVLDTSGTLHIMEKEI